MRITGKLRFILAMVFVSVLFASSFNFVTVNAQTEPLTYQEIITALNAKLPNSVFKNKTQLLEFVVSQIKARRVDSQLTKENETLLRKAGATDELIQTINQNSPNPKMEALSHADSFFKAGDYKKAIEEYNKIIESDPESREAYLQLGSLYYHQNDIESVREVYKRILKAKADLANQPSVNCLFYEASKDNLENAIKNCSIAIEASPNDWAFYAKRGRGYEEKKDFERALADFDKAISLAPNNIYSHFRRGLSYAKKGDSNLAIKDFNETIKLQPGNVETTLELCKINLESVKDYDQAIKFCTEVTKLEPNNALGFYNLGLAYKNKEMLTEALGFFDKAISINPKHADSYYNRGAIYLSKKNYKLALPSLNKAIELNSILLPAYIDRAFLHIENKKYDLAITDCNEVIRVSSNYAEAYNNRGIAYEKKKNYEQAKSDFKKAIEIKSDFESAKVNLERVSKRN